jgi:hypothetical protein
MSLECAKTVTGISGSLYQIHLILQYAAQRRQSLLPAELLDVEAQLQDYIKDGIQRIHAEYNQALSKIGPSFSGGDGMTFFQPRRT